MERHEVWDPKRVYMLPGGKTLVLPCRRCDGDISVSAIDPTASMTCPSCGQEVRIEVTEPVPKKISREEFVEFLDRIAARDGESAVADLRSRIDQLYPGDAQKV